MDAAAPEIVLVCQDMIFTSKIAGTASALGRPIRVVATAVQALASVGQETRVVLIDLSSPRSTTAELASLCAGLPSGAKVIAYGSHVEVDRLREARAAGCHLVLPRSEFTERLAELLQPSSGRPRHS
jgi:DNA-binding NarL/FixJ family response regulator